MLVRSTTAPAISIFDAFREILFISLFLTVRFAFSLTSSSVYRESYLLKLCGLRTHLS